MAGRGFGERGAGGFAGRRRPAAARAEGAAGGQAGEVGRLALDFPREREACPVGSHHALDFAIMTAPTARDADLLAKLDAVAGRVL